MDAGVPVEAAADQGAAPTLINRIFEFDFSRPLAFALLALAFVASRVPFVDNGYGTKPDAWRIALSGPAFGAWIQPTRLLELGSPTTRIAVPTALAKNWIEDWDSGSSRTSCAN